MTSDDEVEPVAPPITIPKLQSGTLLQSGEFRYRVVKTIGKLETYHVYAIQRVEDKQTFEAKVEGVHVSKYARSLRNEIVVLDAVKRFESALPQLMSLVDKGLTPEFRWVVTPHFPKTVEILHKIVGRFTKAEWFRLMRGMLYAIEQLHSLNLAHGCIRLEAFAITATNAVVLTDFALARNNPTTAEPEKQLFYNPPNMFSARAVHEGWAGCCADDLEAWVFCILYLYDRAILPWNARTRRRLMLKYKKKLMSCPEEIIVRHGIADVFFLIIQYVVLTKRNQEPCFTSYRLALDELKADLGVTGTEPVLWNDLRQHEVALYREAALRVGSPREKVGGKRTSRTATASKTSNEKTTPTPPPTFSTVKSPTIARTPL